MQPALKAWKRFYQRFRKWQERAREPGLSALLVIEVALLFIVTPFTSVGLLPAFAPLVVYLLFVLATLVVTSRSHLAASLVLLSVILSTIGVVIHTDYPSALTEWLSAGGRLLAISALSVVIAKAVFGPGRVTMHRVQGAIVLYFNFGLFFFTLYQLVHILVADSFLGLPAIGAEHGSGAALLYFSFSTLTTAGFGDIKPLYPIARNLANLESVIGALFPATLLARLVSLEIEHRRNSKSE